MTSFIEACNKKGVFISVDDEDFEELSKSKWRVHDNGHGKTYVRSKGVYMHRKIVGVTDSNVHVDHIDGNCLNNTRANLRACSNKENIRNGKARKNACGYKGVVFHKQSGLYRAAIRVHPVRISLGYYKTPEEAYAAYCAAAIKHHGEFANLG